MKGNLKTWGGALLGFALLITGSGLTASASTMTDEPEGYNNNEWSYSYEEIEYGFEKLTGASFQGTNYTYLYDDAGMIVGMLDSEGTQVVKYTYDEYGVVNGTYSQENNVWVENNDQDFIGNQNKMHASGMYFDETTDCYYVNQRYFDPVENRYLDGTDAEDILTDVNPYLSTEEGIQLASDIDVLDTAVTEWAESLLASSSYGTPINTYTSNWYSSLSDVEVLARAIYCEGGTAYTSEEDAVAWVILNRVKSSSFPSTAAGVVKQASQFSSITGGSSATTNARIPSTSTTRWEHSTYLACLLLSSSDTTDWKQLVGNTLNGQLYFYSYSYAKNLYNQGNSVFTDSGSSLLYNGKAITKVYVLGYGNVSSFTTLFTNYSPTSYSRNIYYNY